MTVTGRICAFTIAVVVVVLVSCMARGQAQFLHEDTTPPSAGTVTQARARSYTTSQGNPSSTSQDTKLHILTYNTQFRDAAADVFAPRWPNTGRRAHAIGRAIACYDVIALQEEFRDDRRTQVVSAAQSAGASCDKPSRFASGLPFAVVTGPAAAVETSPSFLTTVKRVADGLFNIIVGAFG
jgi:hypothetical protein